MVNESTLLTWKAEGLPDDNVSYENAIAIFHSFRIPFIIDPATQAINWIEKHLTSNSTIENISILNQKFVTTLELSVRFGKTLIVSEVDEIDSMLFPLLRKDLGNLGPRKVVQVGDKLIDFNDDFKLILSTRNSMIILPPNVSAIINAINFTVTKSGLEGQLLGITLSFEQPELEKQKTSLLQQEEELRIQMSDLEAKLLELLAKSEDNILENKILIKSLGETKKKSNTIKESLKKSQELQEKLDRERESYRPLASLGSNIFMLIQELSNVNNM